MKTATKTFLNYLLTVSLILSFLIPGESSYVHAEKVSNNSENNVLAPVFQWPTRGTLGEYRYMSGGGHHKSIDIIAYPGTQLGQEYVYPVYDGVVFDIWKDWSRGQNGTGCERGEGIENAVIIYHQSINLYSIYMHMADDSSNTTYITVHKGDWVTKSTPLGRMGDRRYNPCSAYEKSKVHHLHFTIAQTAVDSMGIDPTVYYPGFQLNVDVQNPAPTRKGTPVAPNTQSATTIRIHANLMPVTRTAKLAISRDASKWDIIKDINVTINADGWSDPIQLTGVPLGVYTFYLKPEGGLGKKIRTTLNSYTNTITVDFSPSGESFIWGDGNGNNKVDLLDFEVWRYECFDLDGQDVINDNWKSDYDNNLYADLLDFEYWRSSLWGDYPAYERIGEGWPESGTKSSLVNDTKTGPIISLNTNASYSTDTTFDMNIVLNTNGTSTSGTEIMIQYGLVHK